MIWLKKIAYNYFYNKLDKLINRYDVCEIRKDENGNISCYAKESKYLCCGDIYGRNNNEKCEYLSSDGCTIKCLGCKMWLCDAAFAKIVESTEGLKEYSTIVYHIRKLHLPEIIRKPFN